jgi:hypothetical protein
LRPSICPSAIQEGTNRGLKGVDDGISLPIGEIEIEREANVMSDDIIGFGKAIWRAGDDRLGVSLEKRLGMTGPIVKFAPQSYAVLFLELSLQRTSFERRIEKDNILVIGRPNIVRNVE